MQVGNIPNDLQNIDPTPPRKNVIIQNLISGVFKYIYLNTIFLNETFVLF